jgi:CubicO group peptidase (beta-lactamase class C family)
VCARVVTFAAVVAIASALAACGDTRMTPSAATHGDSVLRADLQALVDAHQLPGAIAVVERDGVVLARETVGWRDVEEKKPLRDDAIFRLYSMSKPITSVAIMMLVEQGRLALDDPVERYLPERRDMRVYVSGGVDETVTEPARRPISISDLLTHSSGIVYHFTGNTPVRQYDRKHGVMRDTPVCRTPEDGPPARTLDELVSRIGRAPLLHHPGPPFHYSYSTTVLGAVIERVTSQKLDTALDALLFTPLGMTDTGCFIEEPQLPSVTTLYSATDSGIVAIERPTTSDYRDHGRLLDGGDALASTAAD